MKKVLSMILALALIISLVPSVFADGTEGETTQEYSGITVKYDFTKFEGASINAETGVFTWKPDSSQIGENHVAITARDSDGRESTIHFTVTVYGSTTGGSSSDNNNAANEPQTPESGTTNRIMGTSPQSHPTPARLFPHSSPQVL